MNEINFEQNVTQNIDKNTVAVINALRKMKRESAHNEEDSLRVYDVIENVFDVIRDRFWAHGVSRGNDSDKLASLIAILKTNMVKGWSGRFTNQGGSFISAPFLVISKADKELFDKAYMKEKLDTQKGDEFVTQGIKVNIGAVIINDEVFFPLIPLLIKKFPHIQFIRPNQLISYFQEQLPNERIEMTTEEIAERERQINDSARPNSLI